MNKEDRWIYLENSPFKNSFLTQTENCFKLLVFRREDLDVLAPNQSAQWATSDAVFELWRRYSGKKHQLLLFLPSVRACLSLVRYPHPHLPETGFT